MRLTTSFVALALGASSPLLSGASPIPQDNSPANSPNPGHVSGTFDTGRFGGQAPDSSLGDFSSQDDNADPANEPKYQYNANVERGLNLGGLLGSSHP